MKVVGLVAVALCVGLTAVSAQPGGSALTVQGVWRVVSTTGATVNPSSQPSLVMFTGRHYSILRVTANQPRAAVADPAKASTAQLLTMWGNQGFVANAGTYEIAGGTLTIVYAATLEGSTLVLTEVRDGDGPVANPTTLRLTRLE
jgi:hypothetical protein